MIDHSTGQPTQSSEEIPDCETLRCAGVLLDVPEARIVLAALSRVVASDGGRSINAAYRLCTIVRLVVTTVVVQNGKPLGPLYDGDLQAKVSVGSTVQGRLGLSADAIRDSFEAGKGYADRCLPLPWMLAYAPAPYWPAVYSVVAHGPGIDVYAQAAAETLARTPTRKRDYRRAGDPDKGQPTISGSHIRGCLYTLWSLFGALKDLRTELGSADPTERPLDRKLLRKWKYVPDHIESKVKAAEPKVGPPTVPQRRLQEALNTRQDRLENRRGPLPKSELCDLFILATLPVLGERGNAYVNARVEDIDPAGEWPDGVERPSITLYPGKTRDSEEPFTRPIPRRAWQITRAWLGLNGWELEMKGQPLVPGRSGERPLTGFTARVSGSRGGVDDARGRCALIPFRGEPVIGNHRTVDGRIAYDWGVPTDECGWPTKDPLNNPYQGYPPHSYRKACHLAVGSVHSLMVKGDLMPPDLTGIPAKYFKRVITTHALGSDVDAVYDDVPGLADFMLAAIIQPLEDYLWTGSIDGLVEPADDRRYGPDIEAIRAAREALRAYERAFSAFSAELQRLHIETERLQRGKRDAVDAGSKLAISDELDEVGARIARVQDQRLDIGMQELPAAKQALAVAHQTRVLIPAGVSSEEYDDMVRIASGEAERPKAAVAVNLANKLNFGRTAAFLGVTESSIRQYYQRMTDGSTPRALRRILRAGLGFDEVWDPSRRKYDRRLLIHAIDRDKLTQREADHLDELRAEQAADDRRRIPESDSEGA